MVPASLKKAKQLSTLPRLSHGEQHGPLQVHVSLCWTIRVQSRVCVCVSCRVSARFWLAKGCRDDLFCTHGFMLSVHPPLSQNVSQKGVDITDYARVDMASINLLALCGVSSTVEIV